MNKTWEKYLEEKDQKRQSALIQSKAMKQI